jgi:large subunit ribosomal protein L9e
MIKKKKTKKMKHILQQRDVDIPDGVVLKVKSRKVFVKGPRGELSKTFQHVDLDIQRISESK